MGKPQNKGQVEMLTGKLEAAYVVVKRLEAENAKLQRRLHAKSQEVVGARQARREALTLLREAASHDKAISEKAIALLAADQIAEQQAATEAAFLASQTSIPGTDASTVGSP